MPDDNGAMDSMIDESYSDSQNDTQSDVDTSANDTDTSQTPEQPDFSALQKKLERANGQISALQKKIMESARQGKGNPTNTEDTANQDTESIKRGMRYAKFEIADKLENEVFKLYDGSNPEFEGEPSLEMNDLMDFKRNMWAYVSEDAMIQAVYEGNYQPALWDIEKAIADKAQAKASENSNSNVNQPRGKQVNPMPAPQSQPSDEEPEDLYAMPMVQLEKIANAKRRQMN